ncbi:2'-5' RNA ligase family protein [Streptomyces clavuligerus]|uniref:Secreted protein n=1 Tax=Streptomyces clavuligerus TaxID=1901 RepID=E2Q3B6_STRCL|nr:2'-5' RNA ligase family protein [Streptomyces clavuligerus]EFG08831.1 Secreted protein [Streptomyces clavuligerus]MBY6303018.1 2'-5' RNA ligase family protein [Streptomyces clavuligerus]QCS05864.1 2'-5' RNA ligase family protein [Streptomyces clavuligerus]QPJ94770.1 2'-5' RNA ligase family protein [Streptomyces clavuligerus]
MGPSTPIGRLKENDVGTVTLGVSIAVPEPYGCLLQERRAGFGDPAAHGIPTHVTLLPPTEADPALLPAVEAHLTGVAARTRAFPMRLAGTGTFRPVSPVVFVNVVEGGAACSRLQKRIRGASGPLARELPFSYHPHVTVAHAIADEAMDRAYTELSGFEAGWTCASFALYEQGADGVWRKLREYAFGGGVGSVPAQGSPLDDAVGAIGVIAPGAPAAPVETAVTPSTS